VHLSAAVLDRYVGTYQVQGLGDLVITREDTTLWAQPTGQDRVLLQPTSETEFEVMGVEARITFQLDAGGNTTGLVIHQGDQEVRAAKVKP
jgi:hypothetical protein